jgi:hypothetical protein
VHEKGSQPAVLGKEGTLNMEARMPTKVPGKFLPSLPGEKRVAIGSVGFIHPIHEKLSSTQGCAVSAATEQAASAVVGNGGVEGSLARSPQVCDGPTMLAGARRPSARPCTTPAYIPYRGALALS